MAKRYNEYLEHSILGPMFRSRETHVLLSTYACANLVSAASEVLLVMSLSTEMLKDRKSLCNPLVVGHAWLYALPDAIPPIVGLQR